MDYIALDNLSGYLPRAWEVEYVALARLKDVAKPKILLTWLASCIKLLF